jgi:MFS family permease
MSALPSIRRDLGFSVQGLQWVLSGYLVTFGGLLLLGGRAGDLLGRRPGRERQHAGRRPARAGRRPSCRPAAARSPAASSLSPP